MWTVVGLWVCSTLGVACNIASPPDLTVIQAAYDRELAAGSSLHDRNLKILEAKCDDKRGGPTGYLCQVTFMSTTDPEQRLYFDVISIASTDTGWTLRSGLCKR